ncbi:MAG: hypothetical protein E6J29_11400 [Chloroflexi bacterium]|nr:MAG: hypothetical protein E6J29_11400 [Chloroflexota bacterium]
MSGNLPGQAVHLRAITLSGFKTFARRTEIRFDGGMVAIVGPNGSGKSNIVDAFKWVLGETQARDLRGRTMEEVIYAGGERSPRASQAEVALLLDNRDGRLPVDYQEVELKRRVERGGSSDYFLNGSRVRRRDLLQLLASTGLTTDSYSIVNQGDIEAIVTASPEQRRQLLEEAAQVRGVKQQRSEAAAKMADLAQNLLRLEDLRLELRPRLEGLQVQAEAAREALAAQSRLEVLKGSIVWEEWREARDAHRRAGGQKQSLERRFEEARAQAAEAESAFQAGRTQMEAAQDRRLARQRSLGTLQLELSAAGHALALAGERLANLEQTVAALEAELRDLDGRAAAAAALRAQLEKERAAAEAALRAVPADHAAPSGPDHRPGAKRCRRLPRWPPFAPEGSSWRRAWPVSKPRYCPPRAAFRRPSCARARPRWARPGRRAPPPSWSGSEPSWKAWRRSGRRPGRASSGSVTCSSPRPATRPRSRRCSGTWSTPGWPPTRPPPRAGCRLPRASRRSSSPVPVPIRCPVRWPAT